MNCLEFRRLLGTDPASIDAVFIAHRDDCPRCAAAWREAMEFESRLADALALPLPGGLADRIRLVHATGLRSRQRTLRSRVAWAGLAAAACLALAIGLVQWRKAQSPGLADLVVDHVMGEPAALVSVTPVAPVLVRSEFERRGVHLAGTPPEVTYLNDCPIGPWHTVHMATREGNEPVSVIYVTLDRVRRQRDFDHGMWRGREVPIGNGTLVLLAQDSASFDALEHAWLDAIEGPPKVAIGSR
ncbi:MAG: DUF3379 family protein [Rhodanobacteraceae bacterium]